MLFGLSKARRRHDVLPKAPVALSLSEIVEIFPISNFLAGIDRLLAGTILFETGWLRNSPLNGCKHEKPSVQLRRLI
jgi:hypothetical protein